MDWTPEEIRRRRDAKGLSQEDLGRLLGEKLGLDKPISRRAITNWEAGKAVPHGRNLRALDLVLGDQPSVDDPPLSQATFMDLIAEITRRYARATNTQDKPLPDLPADQYAIRSEDAPSARRARTEAARDDQSDESRGGQAL